MIKLEVEDYCQSCPEFEPDVDKDIDRYFVDTFDPFDPFDTERREHVVCDTIIRCEHRGRCRSIKTQIERDMAVRKESKK